MEESVKDYIASETRLAESILANLADALASDGTVDIEHAVRSYVMHRFLLDGVVPGDMDDIESLANESMTHTLQITGGDLDAAGIITGCGGETTWVTKKVKLLFAIQDALGIRFDPHAIAKIKTLGDLSDEVRRLCAGKPKLPSCVKSGASALMHADPLSCRIEDVPESHVVAAAPFSADDVSRIRGDFPLLRDGQDGFVYLDNAATMQVPQAVLDAATQYCSYSYANVHRGIYSLSERSTARYEHARASVARFVGASADQVVFTSGTTEALNMVSLSMEALVGPGDRVVVTAMEHHSNYLPWLRLAKRTGAEFHIVPFTSLGELDPFALDAILEPPTKLLAMTHCSNVLGTVNPVASICARAREAGVITVVDGARGVRHEPVDVGKIGCSFYAFSGHKLMSGPGIGVLCAAGGLLDRFEPPMYGGGMVKRIVGQDVEYESAPYSWEAGTRNLVGAVALEAALEYRASLGCDSVIRYEKALLEYATEQLKAISRVRILGDPAMRAGCVAFAAEGLRAVDVSRMLSERGICVRAGHHCALPLHRRLGKEASVRISPALYNTVAEIDECLNAIEDCMLP